MEILILFIHVSFLLLSIYEYNQTERILFETFAFFGILACVGNEYFFLFIDFLQTLYMGFISLKNTCMNGSNSKILKLKIRNRTDRTIHPLRQNQNTEFLITGNRQQQNSKCNKSIPPKKQIIPQNNYIQGFQNISPDNIRNKKFDKLPKGSQNQLKLKPSQPYIDTPYVNRNFPGNYFNPKNKVEKQHEISLNQRIPSQELYSLNLLNKIKTESIPYSPVIKESKLFGKLQNQRNVNPILPYNENTLKVSGRQVPCSDKMNKDIGKKNEDIILPGQVYPKNTLVNEPVPKIFNNPWNKINDPVEMHRLEYFYPRFPNQQKK